jgi:hypothetical protein
MKKVFLNYLDVVLKFFGLQRIPDSAETKEPVTYNGTEVTVVDEKSLEELRLARFNEILDACSRTSVPDGPKWDMDKRYPVHFEPEVIESHNSDPDRINKVSYESLIDDEHRKTNHMLRNQDPLYLNSTTRRKARTKLIGDNTKTRSRKKSKEDAMALNPEDELFKGLRAEILKNINED